MSKSPFRQATKAHRFQFDVSFHKLELILANPLAKVSFTFTIGSQKLESSLRPKASKETILGESLTVNVTLYEDPKRGQFQEKFAAIDVFLNNSKVSNSIGQIKLDLSQFISGDEFNETLNLSKSIEYQGKLSLSIKGTHLGLEETFGPVEPNDSISQQDLEEKQGGERQRSMTPKNQRTTSGIIGKKLIAGAIEKMTAKSEKNPNDESSKGNKFMQLFEKTLEQKKIKEESNVIDKEKENRKSQTPAGNKLISVPFPLFSKTANVIKEYNDDKKKLEKTFQLFQIEKNKVEDLFTEKHTEKEKEIESLQLKLNEFEKENYSLKLQLDLLSKDLDKEKSANRSLIENNGGNIEAYYNIEIEGYHAKNAEMRKQNEKMFAEKANLEIELKNEKRKINELEIEIKKNKEEFENKLAVLNETIVKYENDIKLLINGINREKKEGTGEGIIETAEKLKKSEKELNIKIQEIDELKSIIDEKNKSNSIILEKMKLFEANLAEKENEFNEKNATLLLKIQEQNEIQKTLEEKYMKMSQNFADIVNLIFTKNIPGLIEEVDLFISN